MIAIKNNFASRDPRCRRHFLNRLRAKSFELCLLRLMSSRQNSNTKPMLMRVSELGFSKTQKIADPICYAPSVGADEQRAAGCLKMWRMQMTLREKRYREITNALGRTIAQRDGCLANLVKYEIKLKGLRRQVQRLERAMASEPKPAQPRGPEAVKPPPVTADDLDVPAFLRRAPGVDKDAQAAAAIREQEAGRKKAKARGRIETMKAKQRGDTRRMPLTGKAALAAINELSR